MSNGRFANLQQPLVSRPAYGQRPKNEVADVPSAGPGGAPLLDTSDIPEPYRPSNQKASGAKPVAESGLPGGGPADKGLSLDKDIPGTSTYNKPENDIRDFDHSTDTAPERIDGPDDMLKDRDRVDTNEDNADKHDGIGYNGEGGRPKDDPTVTKWPYRDGRPDKHYANDRASFIVGLYQLRFAKEETVRLGGGMVRTAARMDDLLEGLNPKVEERGAQCSVQVKRVDVPNLRWIFAVNCGNGPKVVRVKGTREGNIVKFTKMDLNVSCSCPAFRWLGPEFHAKGEDYLLGKPRGTASVPDVKDPLRHNRTCKHVAAVLSHIRGWEIPRAKPKPKSEK